MTEAQRAAVADGLFFHRFATATVDVLPEFVVITCYADLGDGVEWASTTRVWPDGTTHW